MTFAKGDIIAYSPESLFRRDGFAEIHIDWNTGDPYGADTFDQNDTRLTDGELATGYVLFSLDDFEERQFVIVEEYASDDIFTLDTRKGITKRTFVRRGAQPLPEGEITERRRQVREQSEARARSLLLSPSFHQQLVAAGLPEMTADEVRELVDTLRWWERARKTYETSFGHLVRIVETGDGNLNFQVVHTDEDHFEFYRACRALDSKLTALRS